MTCLTYLTYVTYLMYYRISLVFIEFEARILGPSLETNFFVILHTYIVTESRVEACCALPKNKKGWGPEQPVGPLWKIP